MHGLERLRAGRQALRVGLQPCRQVFQYRRCVEQTLAVHIGISLSNLMANDQSRSVFFAGRTMDFAVVGNAPGAAPTQAICADFHLLFSQLDPDPRRYDLEREE
ncbi:hypothetical protein CS8_078220 [Cupriavidus sp. 8B]